MRGSLVLAWRKEGEVHSVVRGKERTFHHLVSVGRLGKKIETLPAKEGIAMMVQVMEDPACEVDPGLAFELCQCLISTSLSLVNPVIEEMGIDCGRRVPRCLPDEEMQERAFFNYISHHELPDSQEH